MRVVEYVEHLLFLFVLSVVWCTSPLIHWIFGKEKVVKFLVVELMKYYYIIYCRLPSREWIQERMEMLGYRIYVPMMQMSQKYDTFKWDCRVEMLD